MRQPGKCRHLHVRRASSALVVACVFAAAVVPAQAAMASTDAPVWAARYDGHGHFFDIAYASALSPDGTTIAVTGQTDQTKALTSADFATVLYETATGDQRWATLYDGPVHGWDLPADIAWSPDGMTLYVTGASRGKGSKRDFATVAYDASTGKQLWAARYDGVRRQGDASVSLVVSPDGRTVFVSGQSHIPYGPQTLATRIIFATVAYDAETGEQLWVRKLDPSGAANLLYKSLLTPDGRTLLVTGWGKGGGHGEVVETAAYDAQTGQVRWVTLDPGAALTAVLSSDGRTLFVAGETRRAPHPGLLAAAIDVTTGKQLWSATAELPGGYGVAWDVALGPDGRSLYATGQGPRHAEGCYVDDYATVAFDTATGHELWRALYDGPGHGEDWAHAVATSPDGSTVYVTGMSSGFGDDICLPGIPQTGADIATVAYDATSGAQLWVRRYASGSVDPDAAYAMAVDGPGNIYVSGLSTSDFITLRYDP